MAIRHLTDEEIQEYLDGSLSPENESVQRHLKTCGLCQETLQGYKSLYLGLEDDRGFRLSRSFAKSVISKVPKEVVAKPRFRYAEALVVLLGIVLAGFTGLYLVDIRPLAQKIAYPALPLLDLILTLGGSIPAFLSDLNLNSSLLVLAGLTLLIIGALDYVISYTRQKLISSFK